MNTLQRSELWQRLRDAALVEGELPPPDGATAPWYVRTLLGIAGWIGAAFLLGFVGAGFAWVMENATASWGVGALTCAAAVVIFRAKPASDFASQFAMAVSFAGQAMMIFGWVQWFKGSVAGVALGIALQQALLFVLAPNPVHRIWCAWSGAVAATMAIADAGLHPFAPAAVTAAFLLIWLKEFDYPASGAQLRAAGYGITLAAVQSTVVHGELWTEWLFDHGMRRAASGEITLWLGHFASGAVLIWAVLRLLRREGVSVNAGHGRVALGGAALLALISLRAPGIAPAAAILVMGYANANRVLAGLGILALLGYLAHFYYSLQTTLLVKSALLACAGIALLGARLVLRRWWPRDAEVTHA